MKNIIPIREQWRLAKPFWRIFLVIVVIQVLAGIIATLINQENSSSNAYWYGSTLTVFPAFLIGYLWHKKSTKTDYEHQFLVLSIIGAASFFITSHALIVGP